jgi:DNA-binding XRE family transcriptional regulator
MASLVYVIIFPKINAFKVGKADDLKKRLPLLISHWGTPDYEDSYYISVPSSQVFKLESSIHFLLSSHNIKYEIGSGKTEMFDMRVFDMAIQYLQMFVSVNNNVTSLVKGINKDIILDIDIKNTHENIAYVTKYIRKSKNMTQEEFAKHIGIHIRVLTCIEREKGISNPTLKTLDKIASSMDLSVGFVKPTEPLYCLS